MSSMGSSSSSSSSGFMFKKLTDNSTINLYLELKSIEDEEEADAKSSRRPKRSRTYIPRNHEEAHECLWKDYFDSSPRFPAHIFRRSSEIFQSFLVMDELDGGGRYLSRPLKTGTFFLESSCALD
ncbi:hypothetical protein Tco_1190560 [Tanacetum coccineum]